MDYDSWKCGLLEREVDERTEIYQASRSSLRANNECRLRLIGQKAPEESRLRFLLDSGFQGILFSRIARRIAARF